jgi:hypothetical protein
MYTNDESLKINQVLIKLKDDNEFRKEIHLSDGFSIIPLSLASIGLTDFMENPEDLLRFLIEEMIHNEDLPPEYREWLEFALEYDSVIYVDEFPVAVENITDIFISESDYDLQEKTCRTYQ